jgi:hypothetical protein
VSHQYTYSFVFHCRDIIDHLYFISTAILAPGQTIRRANLLKREVGALSNLK